MGKSGNKYKTVKNLDQRKRILVQLGRLEAPSVQDDAVVKRKRLKKRKISMISSSVLNEKTDAETPVKKKKIKRQRDKVHQPVVDFQVVAPEEENSSFSKDSQELSSEKSPVKKKIIKRRKDKVCPSDVVSQIAVPSNESSAFMDDVQERNSENKSLNVSQKKEIGKKTQSLKERMTEKLAGARFRFINENLYSSTGAEASEMFRKDPQAFNVYHDGYNKQKTKWPVDPLIILVKQLKNLPRKYVIADMGCGDARLAESLGQQRVHSFDLVAVNDRVTACDMSKVPLDTQSVDVCVYCLSLMGTNLADYLTESNRILKNGGSLKIMEISSRFISKKDFRRNVEKLGFMFIKERDVNDYFIQMDFEKVGKPTNKRPPGLHLKPCKYKKR